jgi:flagellar basal-body rod protein FlgG
MLPAFSDMLNISKTGMQTRLYNLDIISDNLANINTTAFKSSRGNFQEALDEAKREQGVTMDSTQRNMTPGTYKESYSSLHLAIKGAGFFAVTKPDNTTAYTRDGQFQLDGNRRIINEDGYSLVWTGTIPEKTEKIEITEAGQVNVLRAGTWTNVGTIQLNLFPNPQGMIREGQNLYIKSDASGAVATYNAGTNGTGTVLSNMLETSNVSLSEEMTNAIITQRGFQLNTRAFQQTDSMLGQAIALRR